MKKNAKKFSAFIIAQEKRFVNISSQTIEKARQEIKNAETVAF